MLSAVARLSDTELLARVTHLAEREREATASLIAHLAELDKRRAYLAEGCASLFTYCTQVLHLSEHAAYGRIEAARAARRFPVLLERLAEGSVTLTTVGLLAAHLTPENHRELLATARHTSKRQVEELVARLRPQPPVPASVRRLPTASPTTARPTAPAEAAASSQPTPYAAGGASTADNIQLRCRAHNGYEAERYFGRRTPSGARETRAPDVPPTEPPPPPSRPGIGGNSVRTEYGPGPVGSP